MDRGDGNFSPRGGPRGRGPRVRENGAESGPGREPLWRLSSRGRGRGDRARGSGNGSGKGWGNGSGRRSGRGGSRARSGPTALQAVCGKCWSRPDRHPGCPRSLLVRGVRPFLPSHRPSPPPVHPRVPSPGPILPSPPVPSSGSVPPSPPVRSPGPIPGSHPHRSPPRGLSPGPLPPFLLPIFLTQPSHASLGVPGSCRNEGAQVRSRKRLASRFARLEGPGALPVPIPCSDLGKPDGPQDLSRRRCQAK